MSDFTLDARLERDSHLIARSDTSQLRLFNDARYEWLVLIPEVGGAVEWFDLSEPLRNTVFQESQLCSEVLKRRGADKINLGALGNVVSQLHIHIVARHIGDCAWPGPVWGHSPATAQNDHQRQTLINALRDTRLNARFTFIA